MDLRLLHSNCVMDNRELVFHTSPDATNTFQDDRGFTHCAITSFQNGDPDIARDPLSTNRRLADSPGLQMFGTMVVAGPTPDVIYVLIPDSTTSTADDISPADLQHVVGLSLGSAENLGSTLPQEELHLALCDRSLRPTLTVGRQDYWTEITPILRKWQCVNDAACPYCSRLIRVNMSRHLRASHTENQCYWRCPVTTCPMWFTSELNEKDHLERIHKFREGQGCSFYECLRKFGLEWFGRRSFFEQRVESGQALWMDLALAHQSGQELHNHYVITNSPVMAHLRRFFRAAVRDITAAYEDLAIARVVDDIKPSICDQMRREIAQGAEDFDPSIDQTSGYDIPVGESVPPPTNSATTLPPVWTHHIGC